MSTARQVTGEVAGLVLGSVARKIPLTSIPWEGIQYGSKAQTRLRSLRLPYHPSFKEGQQVPADYLWMGWFKPLDVPGVLERLSDSYNDDLELLINSRAIHPQNKKLLQEQRWIRFKDYKKLAQEWFKYRTLEERNDLMLNLENRQEKAQLIQNKNPLQKFDFSAEFQHLLRQHFSQIETPDLTTYAELLAESRLPLAEFLNRPARFYLPEKSRVRHTLLLGKSGYGKSELLKLFAHHYLRHGQAAVIVIDPTALLAKSIAQWPENVRGERLVYLDPSLEDGQCFPAFNPFELADRSEESVSFAGQEISKVLRLILDVEFTSNMRTLFAYCVAVLLRREGSCFVDLLRFVREGQNQDLVAAGQQSPHPLERDFFQHDFHQSEFRQSRLAIKNKLLDLLKDRRFARMFSVRRGALNLEQLIEQRRLIVFNLAKGLLGSEQSRALGLFILATIQTIALKRAKKPPAARTPTHLMLDEAHNYLVAGGTTEEILRESRQYKLHLTLGTQFIEDMESGLRHNLQTNTDIYLQGASREPPYHRLKIGQFYAVVGNAPPVLFESRTDLLDDKQRMSPEEWEWLLEQQKRRYYKRAEEVEATLTAATSETPVFQAAVKSVFPLTQAEATSVEVLPSALAIPASEAALEVVRSEVTASQQVVATLPPARAKKGRAQPPPPPPLEEPVLAPAREV